MVEVYIVPTPDILISIPSDAGGVSNVEIVTLVTGFEVSLLKMKLIVISVVLAVASAAASKVILIGCLGCGWICLWLLLVLCFV